MKKKRYTNWWYNIVCNLIKECARGRYNSLQLQNIEIAMEKAVKTTTVHDNWEQRVKAVYMIFYEERGISEVSNRMHFSERTIKRWKSDFVNEVGKNAGF